MCVGAVPGKHLAGESFYRSRAVGYGDGLGMDQPLAVLSGSPHGVSLGPSTCTASPVHTDVSGHDSSQKCELSKCFLPRE